MNLDNNQEAFFELVRAGLWEQKVRLSQFDKIDYSEMLRLAEEQSVIGLVATGLAHVSDISVPKEELLQFIGHALQLEQQNLAMNEFIAKLINKLRKEDVYAILVKGQGIAQCYEKPLWRASGDVDLLLSDTNYEKAKKVLVPLATDVETEYTHFMHQGMTIEGWIVELHGTQHSRLSSRIDNVIDEVQYSVFYEGNVRSEVFKSSSGSRVQVFLPAPDSDVIFVFTHILHHFFFEGIGMRQICDWCRLLWRYRTELDLRVLESRLNRMGLMTEWKAFAAYAVEYLGMPAEAMPLYNSLSVQEVKKFKKKASRICADILKVGNFGHNREQVAGIKQPYFIRKFFSFWTHLGFVLRHFAVFPKDSILFFGGVLRTGLYAAVRGE